MTFFFASSFDGRWQMIRVLDRKKEEKKEPELLEDVSSQWKCRKTEETVPKAAKRERKTRQR